MELYELFNREQRVRAKVEIDIQLDYLKGHFDEFYNEVRDTIYEGLTRISIKDDRLIDALKIHGFEIKWIHDYHEMYFTKANLKLLEKLRKKYASKSK